MRKVKTVLTITETEASIARATFEKKLEDPKNAEDILKDSKINEGSSGKVTTRDS